MNGVDANTSAQVWLAVRFQESSDGCWVRCLTESQVAAKLNAVVTRVAPTRDYLGVELTLAQKILVSIRKPADVSTADVESNPELLASASRAENGVEWLKASVFLTEPVLLYAQQRSRRFWFGSLIVISAAAALTGLFANWYAFRRQLQLAELQSNFVSSVSHELRTPIAAVRLLVDGLESGKVSGPWKQRQYLRLISQECRRLSSLIENVLDYSRIERGQKQFEFEPTDVRVLTESTVRIIEPFAAERNVALSLSLPANQSANCNSHALMDGRAIEQALLNLIDNAIKHSPEGQTVTVGVERTDGHVGFWVEDHGDGIPPGEHEKIFERFYRLGSELRRETQGVGIGLSIVKHIVEGHGGRMSVRSVVGQGSRFTIELPANSPMDTSPDARG
jgi:signal transduction histidine kinase